MMRMNTDGKDSTNINIPLSLLTIGNVALHQRFPIRPTFDNPATLKDKDKDKATWSAWHKADLFLPFAEWMQASLALAKLWQTLHEQSKAPVAENSLAPAEAYLKYVLMIAERVSSSNWQIFRQYDFLMRQEIFAIRPAHVGPRYSLFRVDADLLDLAEMEAKADAGSATRLAANSESSFSKICALIANSRDYFYVQGQVLDLASRSLASDPSSLVKPVVSPADPRVVLRIVAGGSNLSAPSSAIASAPASSSSLALGTGSGSSGGNKRKADELQGGRSSQPQPFPGGQNSRPPEYCPLCNTDATHRWPDCPDVTDSVIRLGSFQAFRHRDRPSSDSRSVCLRFNAGLHCSAACERAHYCVECGGNHPRITGHPR